MAGPRVSFLAWKKVRHRPVSLISLGGFIGPARAAGSPGLVRHRRGERSGSAGLAGGSQGSLVRHLLGDRSHFARPVGSGSRELETWCCCGESGTLIV